MWRKRSIFIPIQQHRLHSNFAPSPYLWLSAPAVRSLAASTPIAVWSVFLRVAMLHKCCDSLPCVDAFLLHPGSDPQISAPASSALGLSHAACLVRPQLTALQWEEEAEEEEEEGQRGFSAGFCSSTLCRNHLRSFIFVLHIVFPSMLGCYWLAAKSVWVFVTSWTASG